MKEVKEVANIKNKKIYKMCDKRAVSPVIATVFLIVLVMILATIVFIWAKGFLREDIEKFDQPVENSCDKVNLKASIVNSQLYVQNNGRIPVYKIALRKEADGSIDLIEYPEEDGNNNLLEIGGVKSISIELSNVNSIVPVLRGKTKDGKLKKYICADTLIYIE